MGRIPISGIEVFPTITNPASRSRRTRYASCPGTKSPNRSLPIVSGIPVTARLSLIAIGTPANGLESPGSIASAAASADSCATWVKALIVGWSSSIRRSDASVSSRAVSVTGTDKGC